MQKVRDPDNYNPSNRPIEVSLSPESGSLFHLYHSQLSKVPVAENSSQNPHAPQAAEKMVNTNGEKHHKPKRKFKKNRPPNNHSLQSIQRMEKFSHLQMTDLIAVEEEAEKHCTKTFHLKISCNPAHKSWKLPHLKTIYTHKLWKVPELMKFKDELNDVKSRLDCYDIDTWHKHTHNYNPAQRISYSVRAKAKPELLTQAFLKFYEILHAFPLVPEFGDPLADDEFRSLHLCEAPGAFIVALNHFLSLHKPHLKWRWLGNTLNPHFEGTPSSECIADDRFILHTPHNWFFGHDETGNLMSSEYLAELRECVGPEGVSLVTADGSIDCQGNPSEQEAMTYGLHLCEVVAALSTLRKGGAFVLKKFTFFEAESVNIMFLLSCSFDDVFLYKPITSKPGNSEVYMVSIGYNPPDGPTPFTEDLAKFYGKVISDVTLFSPEQIPASFIHRIIDCCSFFKSCQVDAIERNINLYNTKSEWNLQYFTRLKTVVLNRYLDRNLCQPIGLTRRIVEHTLEWDKDIIPENIPSKWGGQITTWPKAERMKFLKDQFDSLVPQYESATNDGGPDRASSGLFTSREFSVEDKIMKYLFLREGKGFHYVFVSRFCYVNLMQVILHTLKESVPEAEWTEVKIRHLAQFEICNEEPYKTAIERKTQKVAEEVARVYPKAVVFDEGHCLSPHSCHSMLAQLLALLKSGKVEEGSDIVFLNCPLLTRLQNGLLTLVSILFEKVVFHESASVKKGRPFFALVNFTSVEKGRSLTMALNELGWHLPEDGENYKTINQVLSLQQLISGKLHSAICRYNSQYCLAIIHTLQTPLSDLP